MNWQDSKEMFVGVLSTTAIGLLVWAIFVVTLVAPLIYFMEKYR